MKSIVVIFCLMSISYTTFADTKNSTLQYTCLGSFTPRVAGLSQGYFKRNDGKNGIVEVKSDVKQQQAIGTIGTFNVSISTNESNAYLHLENETVKKQIKAELKSELYFFEVDDQSIISISCHPLLE